MKLHNQSLKCISISIFVIVSVWAVVFYFNVLDEIYDNIDDNLDDRQEQIIKNIKADTALLSQYDFAEGNFRIRRVQESTINNKDKKFYTDTVVFIPFEEEREPVRMLTYFFEYNYQYYRLELISSVVEEDDLVEAIFWSIVWLYCILLVSIILINNVLLRKLWRPFYGLLGQLQHFNIDKHNKLPAMKTNTREFVQLKNAADTLIRHALDSYNSQKRFTENAAHELQTPLAIVIHKLELLLEKGTLDQADADSVAQTLQIITHLIQLNKSLLLLSRIENKQFVENKDVLVNALIHEIVADLAEFAQFKAVEVAVKESKQLSIKMDPVLARVLFSNLIRNAIFHNKPNGTVNIEIGTALKITNTSSVGQLDSQKIFRRFYKISDSGRSNGLGLAIVQAICNVYGFSISYSFSGEHCFEVCFS